MNAALQGRILQKGQAVILRHINKHYMRYDLSLWYEQLKSKYPLVTDEEWHLLNRLATISTFERENSF